MVVTVRFDDDDETETFLIGSREETASDLEVYSAASPLGKALDGAKEGETRTYETPTGKTMSVTLLQGRALPQLTAARPLRTAQAPATEQVVRDCRLPPAAEQFGVRLRRYCCSGGWRSRQPAADVLSGRRRRGPAGAPGTGSGRPAR